MRRNQQVCFVGGAGHSGSTLLGILLGGHPRTFYAGEAKKSRYLGDAQKPLHKRACKICGEACPVWGGFVPAPSPDLYEQLSRRTGRPVVVDSTKKVGWIERRAEEARAAGSRVGLIFLIRDGRAVVSSRLRKYPDVPIELLVERWRRQVDETERLVERFDGDTVRVAYEELAADPARTLEALCGRMGLPFDAGMLAFAEHEHHPLGGNDGTQHVATRGRARVAPLTARTRDYYGAHPAAVVLDERWRQELPAHARDVFERLAGADNDRLRRAAAAGISMGG